MRVLCSALVAGLLFISNQAYAQVKEGSHQGRFQLGLAMPLTKIEVGSSGQTEKVGKMGPAFGFGYDYQYNKNVSIGGEWSYKAFGKNDFSVSGAGVTTNLKAWTLLATAKGQLMPDEKLRPYGLFGLGLNGLSLKVDVPTSPTNNSNNSTTGVAFALGGGADYDINDQWLAGGELRWNYLGTSKAKMGASNVTSFDILFNLGYKFGA
ncbi:MAG: outer membrane beta-barrel protein [Elusimicrobiota bacterium]